MTPKNGVRPALISRRLVAMLFCQLAQATSLREISAGLWTAWGKLPHLGLTAAPPKRTLAYANAHRSADLYERLFYAFWAHCQTAKPGNAKRFRFKNPLYRLDGTVLDRCLSLFPWAEFRQTKGAVKLQVLLDHAGYFPAFGATTIAAIDQDRWQIECFFKTLKQHLKIKTVVGASENALKSLIWTALMAILLIQYLQFTSTCPLPRCRLIALLHWNLFPYRNLQAWFADPFAIPPSPHHTRWRWHCRQQQERARGEK